MKKQDGIKTWGCLQKVTVQISRGDMFINNDSSEQYLKHATAGTKCCNKVEKVVIILGR